jgi:tRNA modification GTPase
VDDADLTVWNKADLPRKAPAADGALLLSLKTGLGWEGLMNALSRLVSSLADGGQEAPVITRARYRHALTEACKALQRAQEASEPELFAEDLRLAARSLGRITGRVDVEDLLDVIFREFCIGK